MIEYRFRRLICSVVVGIVSMVMAAPALAGGGQGNANPGVIPIQAKKYAELSVNWWHWALSFPAADVPFFNTGGSVDASAHQSGHVWFLAGANLGATTRSARIPTGVQLFFPLANLNNDWPCPDPTFRPDPGESMEHFLVRTGLPYLQFMTDLFAEVDGVKLRNLDDYLVISPLFTITGDPALAANFDPCITGQPQPAVTIGYYLLLAPLPPGDHVVRFGSVGWGQDVTYNLNVNPGHH